MNSAQGLDEKKETYSYSTLFLWHSSEFFIYCYERIVNICLEEDELNEANHTLEYCNNTPQGYLRWL